MNRPISLNLKRKVLFLYTELAGYFLACVEALIERHEVEVHIVRWPVNEEAPFQFEAGAAVHLHARKDLDDQALMTLCRELQPDLLFCSGWIDKGYLQVAKAFRGRIPTVLCLDNHWHGTLKQRLAAASSPVTLKRRFSHVWVPGKPQRTYAHKLGFDDKNIREGFYCADTRLFDGFYAKFETSKQENFPHRFLYIGRYLEFKGIYDLWEAFKRLHGEGCDWELTCVGSGDLFDQRIEHDAIEHLGFIQPAELEAVVAKTSVFILPSHKEPWAVTVHEFAAAGYPLICSDQVGAATRFVDSGHNGFVFPSGDQEALFSAMKEMVAKSDDDLNAMSAHSRTLAAELTPASWSDTLMTFFS